MIQKKDESGQALIELIMFLPLMFTLYALISGFANSINGSINQQKVTRGFFYYRIQNSSTIPNRGSSDSGGFAYEQWRQFGMFIIGWADYLKGGQSPVMPCYRVSLPSAGGSSSNDKCEDKYSDPTTQFIRVGTVYGVCGATYGKVGNDIHYLPDDIGYTFSSVTDTGSCLIQ